MTEIEKIVGKYYKMNDIPLIDRSFNECLQGFEIVEIMQEYAEIYAKRCLEIASEQCRIKIDEGGFYAFPDRTSILNIQLPEHI